MLQSGMQTSAAQVKSLSTGPASVLLPDGRCSTAGKADAQQDSAVHQQYLLLILWIAVPMAAH